MPRTEASFTPLSGVEKQMDRERVWGYGDDPEFNRRVIFDWKQQRPKPGQKFSSCYSDLERQRDKDYVERIKRMPDYYREKSSEAVGLEYCLMDGIKIRGWFGDDVEGVMPASEFDDIANGADLVVYFYDEKREKFVPLAIDATTSSDVKTLEKKFEKIKFLMDRDFLTAIKYAEDPDGKRNKIFMPKVVLGADAETTLKIQKMLLRGRTDKTTAEDKTLEQEISGLSLQTTREQLAFFAYYCLRKHNLTPKLSDEELVKLNHQKIKEITKTPQARELLQSNQQFSRIIWRHLDVLRFIEQAQQKNPQKLSGKITIPSYLRLISSQENWEK